ncbi:hypothetical protein ACFIOY_34570 [Bradyrhizobium sp. TZ2]
MQSIAAARCGLFFAVLSPQGWAWACCQFRRALPIAMEKNLGRKADDLREKAQPVQAGPRPRPPGRPIPDHRRRHHRRRRRLGLLVAPRPSPLWLALAVTAEFA